MAERWPAAWRRVVGAVDLPIDGPWVVAGRGSGTELVRRPVSWMLYRLGFNAGRQGPPGELVVSADPLFFPPAGDLGSFGGYTQARIGPEQGHDGNFHPAAPDAAAQLSWWIEDANERIPALPTVEDRAQSAEKSFANFRDERPYRWRMLAGYRLMHGTGDSIEVIDAEIALLQRKMAPDFSFTYWKELRAAVVKGEDHARDWLLDQRQDWLTNDVGLSADNIADVCAP